MVWRMGMRLPSTVICAPPTLDDGQQNDNDKEEEGDVKEEPQKLIWVSGG